MGDGEHLGSRAQQILQGVEFDLARVVDRGDLDRDPHLIAQHLPRHDVRVMLDVAQHDFVAGPQARAAVGLGHQIDRLGGAAHEDDLARLARPDEGAHLLPRRLEILRRLLAQVVDAAMNVGVFGLVAVAHGIDDRPRFLRARRRIEEDQRLAIDRPLEDGKIRPYGLGVEGGSTPGMRRPTRRGDNIHGAPPHGAPPPGGAPASQVASLARS